MHRLLLLILFVFSVFGTGLSSNSKEGSDASQVKDDDEKKVKEKKMLILEVQL